MTIQGLPVEDMRSLAMSLFRAAVTAADPAKALRQSLAVAPFPEPVPGGRMIVIAVGKAAPAMLRAALPQLSGAHAICVTPHSSAQPIPGAVVFGAGHPVPDAAGAAAARAVMAALQMAKAPDRVIVLLSGGASAMLPAPADGMTLDDKIAVNRLLLASGLGIGAMNLVRQNLSALKGGGMVRLAAPAPVTAYILSDVVGDDLRVIASGPTAGRVGTAAEAREVLQAAGLWDRVPAAVRAHLAREAPDEGAVHATNHLIGSNRHSLEAMGAAAKGWQAVIDPVPLTGDVAAAAQRLLAAAQAAPMGTRTCLIFGGETTVAVRGTGLGGRNQELALRFALAAQGLTRPWVLLSAGTDGRDGPTDAAGGMVDGGSLSRIRSAGADPEALLANNDSHAALAASGDLVITGATGTNVADVQVLVLG